MKALVTDCDFPDIAFERDVFREAGLELAAAQCRTEEQLIDAAHGCDAPLLQYAPVTERVLRALPAASHPLAQHPRVLLTPHAAFYSTAAEVELRRKAALNIVQWATTGRPMYPVIQGTKIPAA
jgi:hypothetical protein